MATNVIESTNLDEVDDQGGRAQFRYSTRLHSNRLLTNLSTSVGGCQDTTVAGSNESCILFLYAQCRTLLSIQTRNASSPIWRSSKCQRCIFRHIRRSRFMKTIFVGEKPKRLSLTPDRARHQQAKIHARCNKNIRTHRLIYRSII